MKPTLKPLGTKRLKLEYDGLLSNFGFKFSLRRCNAARFRSDNVRALRASLSTEERKAFEFELEGLDWEEYLSAVHIPGLLRHAFKARDV